MFQEKNKKNIKTIWLKKVPYQELWLFIDRVQEPMTGH